MRHTFIKAGPYKREAGWKQYSKNSHEKSCFQVIKSHEGDTADTWKYVPWSDETKILALAYIKNCMCDPNIMVL